MSEVVDDPKQTVSSRHNWTEYVRTHRDYNSTHKTHASSNQTEF